jgi:hypothetical protein
MNIIPKLTKDCEREDCALVDLGSTMTIMGFSQTYDKRGRPIDRDPNTTSWRGWSSLITTNYECKTCGALWTVKQCGNEVTISTTLGATMTVEVGAQ